MFQRLSRPGWMAVELRPDSVRLAHVVRSGTARPRLAMLRSFARAGSEAEDLSRLRKSLGLQHYRCTTAAEPGSYQIVQLPAPAVPAAEVKAALRWGVKDAIDFAVDDALIDALGVPNDDPRGARPPQVLAVAARRERVGARVQAFQRAGIALKVVDVAETAQRNLAALFEEPNRGLAFLAFDERGGLLTFTRNGELYALRHIDVATAALADAAPAAARESLYERIALELQRSLDNFDRLFSQVVLQRLLVAPHDGRGALVDSLRNSLALPVDAADLDGAFDCSGDIAFGSSTDQAGWLRPLGLALREEAKQ